MDDQEVMRLTAENTALLNEITSLRAEVTRLRRCLELFAYQENWIESNWCEYDDDVRMFEWVYSNDPRTIAAEALLGGNDV